MSKFTYKGLNSSGEKVTSTVDAADRYAVYELARTEGNTVESIEESGSFSLKGLIDVEKINTFISRIKTDDLDDDT
mgnify:FL=1